MVTNQKMTLTPPPLPPTNQYLTVKTKPPKGVDLMKIALQDGLYAEVQPYIYSVDNKSSKKGAVKFDEAAAAIVVEKYAAAKNVPILKDANWAQLHRWLQRALAAFEDENGNRLDRNSRTRTAIAAALAALEVLPEATEVPETSEAPTG